MSDTHNQALSSPTLDNEQSKFDTVDVAQVLTQRDYRPTAYVASEWEVVGERSEERDFVSLTLEVFRDEKCNPDPMFESFSDEGAFSDGSKFETPGSCKKKRVEPGDDDAPAFDAALFEAELEARYEQGKQAGLAEAERIAEEKIVASYEALASRMSEVTDGINSQVKVHVGALEKKALQFCMGIAKKLVDTTAEAKPDYILGVIRKGLNSLGAAKPLRVRVSMQDYEFLDVIGLPVDLSPGEIGVRYLGDENIKSGCIIETDYGEVNLELDSMWEEVKASLFEVSS